MTDPMCRAPKSKIQPLCNLLKTGIEAPRNVTEQMEDYKKSNNLLQWRERQLSQDHHLLYETLMKMMLNSAFSQRFLQTPSRPFGVWFPVYLC